MTENQKKKWYFPGLCLVMFVMLYLCRDSMFSGQVVGFYRAQFLQFGMFALGILLYLYCSRRQLKAAVWNRKTAFGAVLTLVVLVPMLVKRDWQLMYFNVLFAMLVGLFFTYFTDSRTVARAYLVVLAILAVYSIFATYLLRIPADMGFITPSKVRPDIEKGCYNFWLCSVSVEFVKERNFGLFREPGVYQYFLILAVFLNNYVASWGKNRTKWILNAIFGITLLSTFATGGVIILGLMGVYMFFEQGWYRTRQGLLSLLAVVLALIGIYIFASIQGGGLIANIQLMFMKLTSGEDSMLERVGSFSHNFGIYFRNPFVGGTVKAVLNDPALVNNTSSSTILLAILGTLGGGIHILSWIVLAWEKRRGILMNLILAGILAMSFNTQNLITDVFLWLFPVMAMSEKLLPGLSKKG